jgi:excisionase family DNA binding protein
MLTVPEAARRAGRSPETVRRWIRSGRLRARKVGTQHVVEEADLLPLIDEPWPVRIPQEWLIDEDGQPQPDWERIVREARDSR